MSAEQSCGKLIFHLFLKKICLHISIKRFLCFPCSLFQDRFSVMRFPFSKVSWVSLRSATSKKVVQPQLTFENAKVVLQGAAERARRGPLRDNCAFILGCWESCRAASPSTTTSPFLGLCGPPQDECAALRGPQSSLWARVPVHPTEPSTRIPL